MYARAINQYKKVYIESASPARVLDELLGRSLKDLEDAKRAILGRDIPGKRAACDHALAIIGELTAALDHQQAPELCANLARLYDFAEQRIISGSASLDAAHLDEAARVLSTMREAFRGV
jgi:flagellar secretion chaperone FliS